MMKISFLKFVFGLAFFLLTFFPFVASAGSEHNMSGFAWSSNIGWISFNNTNTGGTVTYGVHKDLITGNLTGYAWSSNIGWIQFGNLSGFPVGAGTYAQNAQVVGTQLRGWARALSYGGGWDGWISLSGTGYGVTLSGTNFASYAWGSDVVGWINFTGVIVGAAVPAPDLVAAIPSPVTAPAGRVDFSSEIKNQGTAPTGVGFTVLFQISTSSDGSAPQNYKDTTSFTSSLVEGRRDWALKSVTLSTPGYYYVRVCADATVNVEGFGGTPSFTGDIHNESNKGNNCSSNIWTRVTITNGGNIPPTAYAGPDKTITRPAESSTSPTSTSENDSDGTIISRVWTKESGPNADIARGTTLNPSFYNLTTIGDYIFQLTVTDDQGATGIDEMKVTVSGTNNPPPSPITVRLTATPNSITLVPPATGTTRLSWTTTGNPESCEASSLFGDWIGPKDEDGRSQDITYTTYGTYTYTIICRKSGTADTTDTKVVEVSIDGECPLPSDPHYTCSAGTYAGDGKSFPTKWTWTCDGAGPLGVPVLCSEKKGPTYEEN
jgi:hypothetical protein